MTPVAFYSSAQGREPVREWLKTLDPDDRKAIGKHILAAQRRWPVGMPLCRPLRRGLWEIRVPLPSHKIARIVFCLYRGMMMLLHGFIKKTATTPISDIELALKRQKEIGS